MYSIASYADLKTYNEYVRQSNLPPVKIIRVSSSKDELYLSLRSTPYSLQAVLMDYLTHPVFYFENVKLLSKIDYMYYYMMSNPEEAEQKIREFFNSVLLAGGDSIVVGTMTLSMRNNKWVLLDYTGSASTVYLPKFVEIIGEEAFYRNEGLHRVISLAEELIIENLAFTRCQNLTEVRCRNGIREVGISAFKYTNLSQIQFSKNLKEIGTEAFIGCHIKGVVFPEGLLKIEPLAFAECKELCRISFPSTLMEIGQSAFKKCDNIALREIDLSRTKLTHIAHTTFQECSSLCKVKLPEGLQEIRTHSFYQCQELKDINFPSSITYIGAFAFNGCHLLEKVNLPDGLKEILREAFSETGIKGTIKLPSSVTILGSNSFYKCERLRCLDLSDTAIEEAHIEAFQLSGGEVRMPKFLNAESKALTLTDLSGGMFIFRRSGSQSIRNFPQKIHRIVGYNSAQPDSKSSHEILKSYDLENEEDFKKFIEDYELEKWEISFS